MSQEIQSASLSAHILSLLNNGQSKDEIVTALVQKGHEEYHVTELLKEVAKLRDAKNRSQALALVLVGALICLASCIMTLTGSFTHSNFSFVLYGLTSLGIIVVFAGLMKVF
ncbi:MAG: hypothetical protein WCG87_04890 [Bacteroidota bacterium]